MVVKDKAISANDLTPQGRIRERQPVAVIDIGSNSVRQVIYEGLTRAPAVLFNEKVLCGLGKGLAQTGRLQDTAVKRAIAAITRFIALGKQAGVSNTFILATAAAREAENGPEFIRAIETLSECEVVLLTGQMEAEYSAYGIRSGFYEPDGIVGDLGGGSLELVPVNGDIAGQGGTYPLGGLKLQDVCAGDLKKVQKVTREHLSNVQINWPGRKCNFYAVGGTWRSLAKLHINHTGYPLQVVHHYSLPADEFSAFCRRVANGDLDAFEGIESVSKNRRSLLQIGAIVLSETLKTLDAEQLLLSSLGVREGYLYSRLSEHERGKDMLLEAAWDLAILRARSPQHSRELAQWTGEAFEALGVTETSDERRYRIASCYLADIGWRAHPDYRAAQSLGIISNAGFVGINHEGRAYLSLANFHRYQGLSGKVKVPAIGTLAGKRVVTRARLLAGLFRVAYLYSASMPEVLTRIKMVKSDQKVVLEIPEDMLALTGERPDLRLTQLGREIGQEITLKISRY